MSVDRQLADALAEKQRLQRIVAQWEQVDPPPTECPHCGERILPDPPDTTEAPE